MNIFTNTPQFGGDFDLHFNQSLTKASSVRIASGYIGKDTILKYSNKLIEIAENGGSVQILIGMAFKEGFKSNQTEILLELNEKLQKTNPINGIYLYSAGKYHGKIYQFQTDSNQIQTLIGSSNFSSSGLKSLLDLSQLKSYYILS